MCLNHSRYPTADTATDFVKEQYVGVYKSFYDFASRYYSIDNLLAGSQVNPAAYKALYPIHMFDVSKQSEQLTEWVVDLTVKMEFSANVPAATQTYALVISDRMLKFKSGGSKMSVLFKMGRAVEMEHSGEVVVVRTLAEDSSTIVVSGGSASVKTVFTPPLHLKNGRDYELAMVNLETYYSFANIRADNISLKWSGDGGKTWRLLHIPTGCYELKAINAEIIRMRGGNSDIAILPNVNTLQCISNVVGAELKVSFDVPNYLASVLGFNKSTYGVGRHASEQRVNIMSVNSILVHCNIIHSSYMRVVQAPVVYNLFPNAAPGQKILEAPNNLIYLPVTVDDISTLSVEDGKALDLRGE